MVQSDVEFGGTDQKFNLLLGRELQTNIGQRPQQVLMVPLLVGTDGTHKMSKSLGNYIGVAEPPNDIYGKVMSITDDLIIPYFELVTDVPDAEITELKQQLAGGTTNPMVLKKRLARELVAQLYDTAAASEAEANFEKVFQKRGVPDQLIEAPAGDLLSMLVDKGLVKSRGEAKRLVEQGAVDIDGNKVTDSRIAVAAGSIIKVGKRGFIKAV
jgi:tyrosyl-tRNA synthetase